MLRSVDREQAGRVIEPRNVQCGSRRRLNSGRQHLRAETAWLEGSTGVEERGMTAWGFPRNLGGPIPSADRITVRESVTRKNPGPVARGIDPAGSENGCKGGIAGISKKPREKRDGKSECLIVAGKQGNSPGGPCGAKGAPEHGTAGGQDDGNTGSRKRLNETTADSGNGETGPGDGLHLAVPPHRHGLAS